MPESILKESINFCIKKILAESLDKELSEITDEKSIFYDLEGGSFEISDIKIKIWKTFDIPIKYLDSKCNHDITVGELKIVIHSFLKK